ncbi:MAG: DEAD/DEAH box helicase, partial [Terriglobia bacterium]
SQPDEKVLIFTQFIETQHFLASALDSQGYRTVMFNGQMKLDEKEDAVDKFRRDAQILISTEAGGEGRNFQFCHIMVNYDLPWNPMKVEQRIGRLDRIGQRKPVIIYNLVCAETVEERVLHVLEHRIGLFEESVGSLDPILGEVEKDIERIVMEHGERVGKVFEEFERDIEKRVREAKERERTLADFVLDRASLRRDLADELLGRTPLARYTDLQNFVREALAYYGGSLNEHPEGGHVISLSPKLSAQLGVKKGVVRGCFDWRQAQELEHLDFFAFGHELIDRIVDLPLRLEPSVTGARSLTGESRGVHIEIVYQIRGEGVRPSGKIIRHMVDATLKTHSEEVDHPPPT